MANHTITILGINQDGTLRLSDNGKTTVSPGDAVKWTIGKDSGVTAITNIIDNSPIDVFSSDPAPVAGTTDWQGIISSIAPATEEVETYTIKYKKSGAPAIYSFDPEIRVKP